MIPKKLFQFDGRVETLSDILLGVAANAPYLKSYTIDYFQPILKKFQQNVAVNIGFLLSIPSVKVSIYLFLNFELTATVRYFI